MGTHTLILTLQYKPLCQSPLPSPQWKNLRKKATQNLPHFLADFWGGLENILP